MKQSRQRRGANRSCIYCAKEFIHRRGDGDHVFPARFGNYRGQLTFKSICPKCNSDCGKNEQMLFNGGPESLASRGLSIQPARRWVGGWNPVQGLPTPRAMSLEKADRVNDFETLLVMKLLPAEVCCWVPALAG